MKRKTIGITNKSMDCVCVDDNDKAVMRLVLFDFFSIFSCEFGFLLPLYHFMATAIN